MQCKEDELDDSINDVNNNIQTNYDADSELEEEFNSVETCECSNKNKNQIALRHSDSFTTPIKGDRTARTASVYFTYDPLLINFNTIEKSIIKRRKVTIEDRYEIHSDLLACNDVRMYSVDLGSPRGSHISSVRRAFDSASIQNKNPSDQFTPLLVSKLGKQPPSLESKQKFAIFISGNSHSSPFSSSSIMYLENETFAENRARNRMYSQAKARLDELDELSREKTAPAPNCIQNLFLVFESIKSAICRKLFKTAPN